LLKKIGGGGLVFGGKSTQQVAGGIALRVEVNDQRAQALAGADGGQIAGDGGLANAPFLIEHDDRHERLLFLANK